MNFQPIPESLAPNDRKFKELILFICKKSEGDAPFGATKLNKLLFFADFMAFRSVGRAITNHRYQRLNNGPAPRAMMPILQQLQDEKAVAQANREYHGPVQKRTLALREPDLDVFDAREIAIVSDLIEEFRGMNATQMSNLSHEFRGWQLADDGEDIPYEMALVEFQEQAAGDLALSEQELAELARLKQECG